MVNNKQISFGEDADKITLECEGQTVYCTHPPASFGWRIILFLLLMPLLVIDIAVICLICYLPVVAIEEKSVLCLLGFIVFLLGSIPVVFCTCVLQSLLFRFQAIYNYATGTFRLKYGLLHITRNYDPQSTVILICLSYQRGDWGYGAIVRAKKGWLPLPFIPTGVIGSKAKARREAVEIRDWLYENNVLTEIKGV